MSLQVEKMEHNMAKLTVEVPAGELEKAIENVYQKSRKGISIPGFRKGKAPRNMIERMYGKGVFLEDAVNDLLPDAYAKAAEESELEIVSRPSVDITQVEPGQPLIFTAEVALKPDVVLGAYKGIEVAKAEVGVTDAEIEEELHKEQDKNSRLVTVEDRPAELGDTVTLDYEGFMDGEAFQGGKGENHPLTLGSGMFIPGFEDQLVGVRAGESTVLHVTFPEDYGNEDFVGKEAEFRCEIHKVEKKELPELDDEFAMDVSEFDTLEEYRADIRKTLLEEKEAAARRQKGDEALKKVVENAQIDLPQPMIETQQEQMKEDFVSRLRVQGMELSQYLVFAKITMSEFDKQMEDRAVESIQSRLVLEKIVEVEDIRPTQEQMDEELQKSADVYKMEIDKLKEMIGDAEMEQVSKDLAVQQALDLVIDASREV